MSAGWGRLWAMVRSFARAVGRRERLDAEMEEEIGFHLDSRAADLEREGVPGREARRRARVEFGGAAAHKDAMRRVLGVRWLDELAADLRYAVRLLAKSPGFTVIAVGSLALAIGANTTVFSAANLLLYEQLKVPHPEQLQALLVENGEHSVVHSVWGTWINSRSDAFTYPVYEELRRATRGQQEVFGFKNGARVTSRLGDQALNLEADLVSGNYYEQMQIRPIVGRPIQTSDDGLAAPPVTVISYGLWQRYFGGSADVAGRTIVLDGLAVTIVGVNPRGFNGTGDILSSPDLFLPLRMVATLNVYAAGESPLVDKQLWWLQLGLRSASSRTLEDTRAKLDVVFNAAVRGTVTVGKSETVPHVVLQDGSRGLALFGFEKGRVYTLIAFVGLVLLLACANIANLMLARAVSREREMSLRLALGAGRARVFRQLLTESLLLSLLGGGLGLILGYPLRNALGRGLLPAFSDSPWRPSPFHIAFDWKIFCFTATLTLLTSILFGLAPAWRAMRTEANTVLKEANRSATRRRGQWSGKALVMTQVALSTLLVVGAALFTRTMIALTSLDPGFRAKDLLLFAVTPPPTRYPKEKAVALHTAMEQSVARVRGVDGIAATQIPFLSFFSSNGTVRIEGEPDLQEKSDRGHIADQVSVGPGFHSLMRIPILRGRGLTEHDTSTSPRVAVINLLMAHEFFPKADPLGRRISTGEDEEKHPIWMEVVGICADTYFDSFRNGRKPTVFTPYRQEKGAYSMTYVVRSREPVEHLVPALKRAVAEVDPDLPLTDIRTQQQQIDATMQQERTFAGLTASFGLLALVLACVGVYGVMAYTVSQRTSEIGIRLALGAARGQVRGMVLREAGWLAVLGVAVGLLAALGLGRLVRALLYGVSAVDPLSLSVSAGLLLLVALLAGWVPAARASRIDPMEALRHE